MRKLLMCGVLLALRAAVACAQGSPIVTQQYGNGLGGGVHTYLIASTPADDGGDYDHLHLVTTFNCNDYAGCNSTLDATFGNRGGFLGVYTVKGAYSAQANVRLVAYRDSSSVTYIYLILANYYDLVTYTVLESIDDSVYPNPTDLGDVTPLGTIVFDTSSPAYPPANYTDFAGDFITTGVVGIGNSAPLTSLEVNGAVFSPITSNSIGFASWPNNNTTYNFIGAAGEWGIRTDTSYGVNFDVFNQNSPMTPFYIGQNGNVGIRTITPRASLEVNGNIKMDAGGFTFPDGSVQTTAAGAAFNTSATIVNAGMGTTAANSWSGVSNVSGSNLQIFGNQTNARLIIDSTLNDAAELHLVDGAAATNQHNHRFYADNNGLVLDQPNDNYSSTTPNMFWANGGNIGIGTTIPQSKLDVTGSIATDITGTENEFQLTRPINGGVSFPQVAAFQLGTWNTSGACCGPQTRLDINLKANPDGNLTGDTNVMSLLSNGSVGIGTSNPGADLPGNMPGRTNFEVNGNVALKQVPGGTAAGGGSIVFSDGTIQSTAASNSISGNSLPSNVVSSSLTSVGTVTSGVWNASPLTPVYLPSDLDYIDQAQTISTQKTFTGGVSVSMGGQGTPFTVQGAALGNTSGNTTALMTLQNSDANANYLSFSQYRNANGSYWNTATTRIQTVTDVTAQGYIDFNPPNGQYGLAMGSGSSEYFRIAAGGNIGIGTTNPGAMLDVAGNVKISGSGASLTFPDGTVQSTAYVGTTCSTGAEQLGPATAPSGSCSTNGAWAFSQDGHATFCASGTWTTKI